MNIYGKTALITGGAVRIGKAITLGLAKAGANVIINFNSNEEEALNTAKEAEAFGVKAMIVQANIADLDQVRQMFSKIHEEMGPVDILVNSASPFVTTPVPTDDFSAWHLVTGVLVNGAFYVSNLAAKDMLENKEGAIINIIDLTVWEAWPNFTAHTVGKSALYALNRQLALELKPYVRVNAVCPGPVLAPPDYSEEKIARTAAKTLLDRWGTPEDVSKAVNFLVEADYVNADVIRVDGGQRYATRKIEAG
jgi:NAD(P)-dependent dehydrogenase (short-subunit alcohol dehydrogenase family)